MIKKIIKINASSLEESGDIKMSVKGERSEINTWSKKTCVFLDSNTTNIVFSNQ